MSAVFGHGRLRLYLLKLLDEEPRHGYDIIRLLEDRFMGVYAPSAGTIYPRLSRLEEEGLVEHEVTAGKKVYRLTAAGRAELTNRQDELAALEQDIDRSARDLAREVREDVRSSVRGLREELKAAAREVREAERAQSAEQRSPWDEFAEIPGLAEAKQAMQEATRAVRESTKTWQFEWADEWRHSLGDDAKRLAKDLFRTVEELRGEVRKAAKTCSDEEALRELHQTLQNALAQVREVSRR